MCAMVAIVLLLLSKPDKRRTPIFILNISALTLNFFRMLFATILYNGQIFTLRVQFLDDNVYTTVADFVPLYLYTIITIIWYVIMIVSLIVQVRVVFGAEPKTQKYLTYALGALGVTTMGFVLTYQVTIFKGSLPPTYDSFPDWMSWVGLVGRLLFTITVGISSGIFVAKLLYLIHRRRRMGFKGFGPLQVIVIMGCQCMLVPRNHPLLESC
jgi:pheromone alpha factor receptor